MGPVGGMAVAEAVVVSPVFCGLSFRNCQIGLEAQVMLHRWCQQHRVPPGSDASPRAVETDIKYQKLAPLIAAVDNDESVTALYLDNCNLRDSDVAFLVKLLVENTWFAAPN